MYSGRIPPRELRRVLGGWARVPPKTIKLSMLNRQMSNALKEFNLQEKKRDAAFREGVFDLPVQEIAFRKARIRHSEIWSKYLMELEEVQNQNRRGKKPLPPMRDVRDRLSREIKQEKRIILELEKRINEKE